MDKGSCLLLKPGDLSSSPRIHLTVEGKNQLHKDVFRQAGLHNNKLKKIFLEDKNDKTLSEGHKAGTHKGLFTSYSGAI